MSDGHDAARVDMVELVAAILLGIAALAIAWSTYQAGLWGGIQDEGYTESAREASAAVDQLQAADRVRSLDQLLFVEIRSSQACEVGGGSADAALCERLVENLSDPGRSAVEQWSEGDLSPFETADYVEALYANGTAARETSDQRFESAGEANEHSDNHELAATILTAVLFFAGVATVVDDRRIGWGLIAAASVFLVAGLVYSATLPLA